jgi:4-amino-4-deoxy-L-arabinose transferase-like glycosyltransferase
MALRAVYLSQPMRVDEAATYLYYVRKPPLYGLVSYTLPNNHVLHTLLVSVSTFLFGNHPWVIRIPAFAAGVAMIPLSFVVARQLYGEAAGLITAAFVASSSILIEYSTNARGYTIVAALFLGLLALKPALMKGEARAWRWFAILGALGFFTIPTMFFPFGVVVAWLAVAIARAPDEERRALRTRLASGVGLTFVLTVAAYLPAILWTGPRALFANRFVVSRPWDVWLSLMRPLLGSIWRGWNGGLGIVGMVLFLGLFAIGLVRGRTSLALIAVAWCVLVVIAGRWYVYARVWTFLVPIYWMTVAAGMVFVLRRSRFSVTIAMAALVAIGVSILASGTVVRSPDGAFPDAERVAVALRNARVDDEVLTLNPVTAPLQYYAVLRREPLRLNGLHLSDTRIFIVVDIAVGQTLGEVALGHAVPRDVVARATIFKRFVGATIYLYEPPVPT